MPISRLLDYSWLGGLLPATASAALKQELDELLRDHIGIGLMTVSHATAFITAREVDGEEDGVGAVLIREVGGSLSKLGPGVVQLDEEVYGAQRGNTLIIGGRGGVELALAVLDGAKPALAPDSTLARHAHSEGKEAPFLVAIDLEKAPAIKDETIASLGLKSGVLVWRDGPRLVLRGDAEHLAKVQAMVKRGIDTLVALVDVQRKTAKLGGPLEEAIGAVIASHHLKHAVGAMHYGVTDDRLVIEMKMTPGLTFGVGLIGMSAAVAIPAFMKYLKKSKTTEARDRVKQIHDGARAHYYERGALPPSAPLTPADPSSCCGKCAPELDQWNKAPWIALQFSVDEPHLYAYEFVNEGSSFVARAVGDLDCDGEFSTFELRGRIEGGEIVSDELTIEQEIE